MKKILILVLVLTFGLCAFLHAETDSESSDVTLTVGSLFDLQVASASASQSLTGSELSTAFSNGYTELDSGYPTLSVISNQAWYLKVKSDAALFTYSGSLSDPSKSVSDLMIKDNGTANVNTGWDSYNALTVSDQTMAYDNAGTSGESHPCQYKILLDAGSDVAGTYSMDVTFTLTTTP